MKVSHKVALCASFVVVLVFSIYSWMQYSNLKTALFEKTTISTQETSKALAVQVNNWLNSKLALIDIAAQNIETDFNGANIQKTFDLPLYKQEFLLIFGGLSTDGKRITNDPSWNPANWDARKRPWYPLAKAHKRAILTEPYADSVSGELLISAVANFYDNGKFKGAFGGDLSLKTVSDAVNTLNFNHTGYAFILNKEGNIISHPQLDFNGKNVSDLIKGGESSFGTSLKPTELLDGTDVFTTFSPLSNLYGTDWYIGVVLEKHKVMSDVEKFGWIALISTIIAALLCSAVLYYVVSQLLLPLKALRESLQDINCGEGDLVKRLDINSNDEFGKVSEDFNQFLSYLQNLIKEVKSTSSQVRLNTDKTEDSSSQAAQELNSQLSELDQLATAMSEMSATAHDVAGNAQSAAQKASEADDIARSGVAIVDKTSASIAQLTTQMGSVVTTINELVNYSNNIESILTVITDIADQTNLLALNAAIEAARAGEQGRGFAVVADEVRTLASKTQESTEQIKGMISQLQVGVKNAESVILKSRENADETQQVAIQASTSLNEIRASIDAINGMNVQIATAAEEQSMTTKEINQNTQNIRNISQSVSDRAMSQEGLCKVMVELTEQQEQALAKFKV
ncbi:MAG: methyl-accepting chemotaxis protein [Marinomonas sp.]|jgi:methyl-accepting chemotaxis protein|uniref:methyl-accepting chemotaxis protein n=1 Tax=unclassified Marinomonas TaxID=196814 RepID=UPI0007AEFE2C|nr:MULTISPECIES: methyl-accepting chemotaxis protein [unclassified Marinomonas]KZM41600.1 chemotaxis protein [Marinomonas sp. SBI22]KZM43436.1 chemotaxis protein [Marinomonas sp. SBI8L]